MTDEAAPPESDATMLRALCEEARSLAGDLRGPLSGLTLRAGDHAVEIAWGTAPAPSPQRVQARVADGARAAAEPDRDGVEGRSIVTAPLVGFFYRCPEPGAQPFVEVGQVVESGQDVAIVGEERHQACPVGPACTGGTDPGGGRPHGRVRPGPRGPRARRREQLTPPRDHGPAVAAGERPFGG